MDISHLTRNKKIIWIIAIILTAVLSTLLFLISTFGKPVADQYSFINRYNNGGTFGLVNDIYTKNSGRISQAIGIGLSYSIFGPNKSQIIIPALLFILLSITLAWFFYLTLKTKENHLLKSTTLGILASAIVLYVAPCLFDIYLWLDADFVYLGSTIGLIFNLDFFIWMIKTKNFHKKWFFIPLAIICILNLLFNESVVALFFGWSLVALIISLVFKKFQQYRFACLSIFTIAIIATIIMFSAPGTWNRMSSESGTASLLEILFRYPTSAFLEILKTWSIWKLSLVSSLGILIGIVFPKIKPRFLFIGAILCLITITYGTLAVTFYGQKYGGIASRTMFTPNLGIVLAIILSITGIYNLLMTKYLKNNTLATIGILLIFYSLALPGFLRFNHDFISILAVRNNFFNQREILTTKYRNGEIKQLTLPDLPVMIENSNASDFSVNNSRYYDWFYDNFAAYHGIDPKDLIIQGGDIKSDWWEVNLPSWYQVTKTQICLEGNSLIDQKYVCSNQ